MRILVVQHDDQAPSGTIGTALDARGARVTVVRRDAIPVDPGGHDAVVILGAVDSVLDHAPGGSWYEREQALLRRADALDVPVLGVCFGAQALAHTFGGHVYELARPEVGWTTVRTHRPDLVPEGPWLDFHVDAVVPPPGARILAVSDACVQAFTCGIHLAVQFHPEVVAAQVDGWCDWLRSSVEAAGASVDRMRADSRRHEAGNAQRCLALVDAFLDGKHLL